MESSTQRDRSGLSGFPCQAVSQRAESQAEAAASMKLVLGSHVFVWVKSAPQKLSPEARGTIMDPRNQVFVSLASAWELWIKHAKTPVIAFARVLDGGAGSFSRAASD